MRGAKLGRFISLVALNAILTHPPICHSSYWFLRDLRGALRSYERHFHSTLCLMGGGEARRLTDTEEVIRDIMSTEKKPNIFPYCKRKFKDSELTNAGRQT